MLNEHENQTISNFRKVKMTVHNVVTFYSLAKLYNLALIFASSMSFIERLFPMIVETQNFLHLDFNLVAKILDSSELNIHSEVEIINAANTWLKQNSEERSKYAKQLLLKVRLSLLSREAVKHVLEKVSLFSFYKSNDCVNMLKTVLADKKYFQHSLTVYYTGRYCSQNKYNLLICGGFDERLDEVVSKVHQVNGNDMNNPKHLTQMKNERRSFEAVCLKGEVYVFGGIDNCENSLKSVEKYSPIFNEWSVVNNKFDKRQRFCACAFMDGIYVFGGYHFVSKELINSCLQLDTKKENWSRKKWKEIAGMNVARYFAACVDFQGNILVSGGIDDNYNVLNTVESYDVFANKWTPMPNMICGHVDHNVVTVKNKLFVFGYTINILEVFDAVCQKFVYLKHLPFDTYSKCVPIGNKIVVFQELGSSVVCYDVGKDEWSEESFEVTKDLEHFSCVKLPWY